MGWLGQLVAEAAVLLYPGCFLVLLCIAAPFVLGFWLGLGTLAAGILVGLATVSWVRRPAPSARWIPDDPESRNLVASIVLWSWALLLTAIGAGQEAAGVGGDPGRMAVQALATVGWVALGVNWLGLRKRRQRDGTGPPNGKGA